MPAGDIRDIHIHSRRRGQPPGAPAHDQPHDQASRHDEDAEDHYPDTDGRQPLRERQPVSSASCSICPGFQPDGEGVAGELAPVVGVRLSVIE